MSLHCHLCTQPLGDDYVQTESGMYWCSDLGECKERALGRLKSSESRWGKDLAVHRRMGDQAEREAEEHFNRAMWITQRHPRGKTGPDIRAVSELGRGESYYVEVRWKKPTFDRLYGLEENKLEAWRELNVLYLIKDHERRGWYVAQMSDLGEWTVRRSRGTYLRGKMDTSIYNVFWPIQWWLDLGWEYE